MLTKAVRAVFIPGEYPATMRRLYSMSPDEAIPEFYSDATVVESVHGDMADLQVPDWAADARDFVQRHRCELELAYQCPTSLHNISLLGNWQGGFGE